LLLRALHYVGLLVARDDAGLGLHSKFLGGVADDQAVGFVAALQFDLPRLKPKRNTRARIEYRFVKRVLAELRADFRTVRAKVNAFAVDLMTFDAAHSVAPENLRTTLRVARHFDQFRNRWQRLRVPALRQRQHLRGFGLDVRPANVVEFGTGNQLYVVRQLLFFGELEQ